MNTRVAHLAAIMGLAAWTMACLFPITGMIAGMVTGMLDAAFGPSWAPIPILLVAVPFSITYVLYCIGFGVFLFFVSSGDDDQPYPPTDSQGRPMVASFSSRGGPFRFIRRP